VGKSCSWHVTVHVSGDGGELVRKLQIHLEKDDKKDHLRTLPDAL
jgi:hypothetical protein